jgi:hypothetical protein
MSVFLVGQKLALAGRKILDALASSTPAIPTVVFRGVILKNWERERNIPPKKSVSSNH